MSTSPSSLRPCRRAAGRCSRGRRRRLPFRVPPSLPLRSFAARRQGRGREPAAQSAATAAARRPSFFNSRPPSSDCGEAPLRRIGINSTIISAVGVKSLHRLSLRSGQSRPQASGRRCATIAKTPRPATRKVARGLGDGSDQAAERRSRRPGIAAPIDSSTLITRACIPGSVSSWTALIAATHWTPLPVPPTTEAAQASARVGRRRQAEVAGADRERAEEEQDGQRAPSHARRRRSCRAPCRRPSWPAAAP